MEQILKLKAKHFSGAVFDAISDCAIARAAKEQYGITDVNVSTGYVLFNGTDIYRLQYNLDNFKADKLLAETKPDKEEVIRQVKLTPP